MVLGFGQTKADDIAALIGRKQYGKAIEAIKVQLAGRRPDPRLRLQLADVLVLTGKTREAVAILTPLADEFAREGYAAKAISVLKKIQKIDPSRRDVDAKLASLIKKKQEEASPSVAVRPSGDSGFEIGMEEIGFEPPARGPVNVPAAEPPPPLSVPPVMEEEIGFAPPSGGPVAVPARPEPEPEPFAPVLEAEPLSFEPVLEPLPAVRAPEPVTRAPEPKVKPPVAPARPAPAPVVDSDFVLEDADAEPLEADAIEMEPLEAEPIEVEPVAADADEAPDTMTDSLFAEELLSLVEDAFKNVPSDEEGVPLLAADASAAGGGGGSQIVVSPLFANFSVDELVAVIHGLNLVTFESGDIIITQGEAGHSLYMLTAGTVKAFVKNAQGRQTQVYEFKEGAFFGEGSILTGKPRSATLIAATRCELLELDRPTLDSIVQTHPHVLDVMQEFARQRTGPAKQG